MGALKKGHLVIFPVLAVLAEVEVEESFWGYGSALSSHLCKRWKLSLGLLRGKRRDFLGSSASLASASASDPDPVSDSDSYSDSYSESSSQLSSYLLGRAIAAVSEPKRSPAFHFAMPT